MLKPELWVQRVRAEDVVRERMETVATPVAEPPAREADQWRGSGGSGRFPQLPQ
jgi:hypothetical protein